MLVIYSEKSKKSIKSIHDYISRDNIEYARKEIEKIRQSVHLIEKNPYIGTISSNKNTRKFFIPTTNYFVVYQVQKDTLEIITILHTSRKY